MSYADRPHAEEIPAQCEISEQPSPFDAVAVDYDADFTNTVLGRMLRRRVWSILDRYFTAGDEILELACGTGEDAVWLAKRGVRVTATDASAGMIRAARGKVARHGLAELVSVRMGSLEQIVDGGLPAVLEAAPFDGVLSNFGGLNAVGDLRPLAEALSGVVKVGGKLVLTLMGPYCPWEVAWHLAHGRPAPAFRRFRGRAMAKVGRQDISLWYPTAARLRRDFGPWFRRVSVESLGLLLPPTYLGHLVQRRPGLFSHVDRWEKSIARFTGDWGDHFVIVLERIE